MKRLIISVVAILLASTAYAALYRVNVSRVDQDLYSDRQANVVIQTQYCYHYCFNESAVLKYEQYSYDNKLIFNDGTTCNVEAVR